MRAWWWKWFAARFKGFTGFFCGKTSAITWFWGARLIQQAAVVEIDVTDVMAHV